MSTITKRVLESIATIGVEIEKHLGKDARFFIKGGAAVPLLLEGNASSITSDVDTYLTIDPTISDLIFERKRGEAIHICVHELLKDFAPTLLAYGSSNETTERVAGESCCKPFRKEYDPSNPFGLYVFGNLVSEGEQLPLTLVTLKYIARQANGKIQSTPILDIIIPKREYSLLQYMWDTVTPVLVKVRGVYQSVPVMNAVSAYINQSYAGFKSKNYENREKRRGRAKRLLSYVNASGRNTRKKERTAALSTIDTNEKGIFRMILSTLGDSANIPAKIRETTAPKGAGAGAGAGASALATPLRPLPSSPSISPSRNVTEKSELIVGRNNKTRRRNELHRRLLAEGKEWIEYDNRGNPLYKERRITLTPERDYILQSHLTKNAMNIYNYGSGHHLTHIDYIPHTVRTNRGNVYIVNVYANGKLYAQFDPRIYWFDPITMSVQLSKSSH